MFDLYFIYNLLHFNFTQFPAEIRENVNKYRTIESGNINKERTIVTDRSVDKVVTLTLLYNFSYVIN